MSVIKVRTAQDLDNVRNNLTGYYVQTKDIDLSNYTNWNPIGGTYENLFQGVYDGRGFQIKNLRHESNGIYKGLLTRLGVNGTIINTHLRNVNVVGRKADTNPRIFSERYNGFWVGAFAGRSSGRLIGCSVIGGKVVGKTLVGGLAGEGSSASITERSESNVEVIGTGSDEIWHFYTKHTCWWETIEGLNWPIYVCDYKSDWWYEYNTFQRIGGLFGYHTGNIKDCYARGPVKNIFTEPHVGRAGGALGETRFLTAYRNFYPTAGIKNSYSTGPVTGTGARGFIGLNDIYDSSEYIIDSCYYDKETSNRPNDLLGIPTTTEDMKLRDTFVGWDFKNVWTIDPKINDGYPSFLVGLLLDFLSGLKLPDFTFYFPLRFSLEPYLQNFRMFQMMYNKFVFDINLQLNSDVRYGPKRYPPVYLKDHIGFVLKGDNDRAIMETFNYNFRMLSSIRNLPLQMISDPKNMNDVCKRNFEMLNSKRRFL